MRLSVVIPAKDEAECIHTTLSAISSTLSREHIPYELVVVDDGSSDGTAAAVAAAAKTNTAVRCLRNSGAHGFGRAVRLGLDHAQGDVIAVMMADGSDNPEDLVAYYREIEKGYECVFGSRFIRGGKAVGYPVHKLVLNRLANGLIRFLFRLRFNDVTNAFKCYRREVIQGIQPLISPHFNLTVEMPLKAIIRGYSYSVVPITWTNRLTGVSKLRIKEMGSRYLFIVLYLWLEHHFSRGDYRRTETGKRLDREHVSGKGPARKSKAAPNG